MKKILLFTLFFTFWLASGRLSAQCNYTLEMLDSYGDGWNGALIDVLVNGTVVLNDVTLSSGSSGTMAILVNTGDTITTQWVADGSYPGEVSYNILDANGTTVAGPGNQNTDLGPVAVACPSCLLPTAQTSSNPTDMTIDLSWTAGGTETQWEVEYGTAGFTQGTGTVVSVSTNPTTTLTGLTPDTQYDWYVRAICGGGNGNSPWTGPSSFTTTPTPGTCGLFRVDLEDTYGDGWSGGTLDVYVNGTAVLTGLTLADGYGPESHYISVNTDDIVSFDYTAGTYSNENLYTVFDETDTQVAQEGAGGTTPGDIGDYTIPTGLSACASCPSPSNLAAGNFTASSADLSWTANGTETQWDIEWGPSGFAQGSGTPVTGVTNPYTLSGLTGGASYDYYVRADCGGGQSPWQGPFTWTQPNAGDDCTFPILANVEADCATATPNTLDFAQATNEYLSACDGVTNYGYWLKITAPANGVIKINNTGSGVGLVILDGCGGTEVYCNNNSLPTSLSLSGLTGGADYWLYFWKDTQSGTADICIEAVPCPFPTNIAVNNVTASTADITWTTGGASDWEVAVQPAGTGIPTGPGTPVTGTPAYTATGLTDGTDYEVYVRDFCNPEYSVWSGPVNFTTLCGVKTPPYLEDFASFPPNCWLEGEGPVTGPDSTVSSGWTADGFANNGTTGAASFNLWNTGDQDWLISPQIDLSAGGYELKFDVAVTEFSTTAASAMGSDDEVQLLYTEDGVTWTNLMTWNAGNTPSNTGDNIVIPLTMTGTAVRFAFWANEGTVDDPEDYNFYVDNFVVQTPPALPECATLVAPADGATDAGFDLCTNTVTLSWQPSPTGTTPVTYEVWAGVVPGNLLLMGTVTAPTTTYDLAVSPSTTYYWQIIPKDAGGNAPSATCAEWSFTTMADANSGADGSGAGGGGYDYANDMATGTPSVPTYNWIDPVANGHTQITAMTSGTFDDGYFTVPDIGFDFPFYGTNYGRASDVHIHANGLISFGAAQTIGYSAAGAASIPDAAAPNNIIAALAMDLDDRTDGKIYYGTYGSNFVVTWYHYHDYGSDANYMTFQVILFDDGYGTITMQYNDVESTAPPSGTPFETDALIGIENSDGSIGAQYRNNGTGGPILCSPRAIGFSTNASVLPIQLTDFSGKAMERSNMLMWRTESERNAAYFEVQRATSSDLKFETIGRVDAKGNSSQIAAYQFEDRTPAALAYYRLKMVDVDGSFEYSNVINLLRNEKGLAIFGAYPVPVSGVLTVEFAAGRDAELTMEVTDLTGKVVLAEKFNAAGGVQKHTVDMSELSSGTYFIKLSDVDNSIVKRVVKQ